MKKISRTDRAALIRLASTLEKGSASRQTLLKAAGQWGSYGSVRNGVWSDVLVMSPNGDSILVNGEETYVDDVPRNLHHFAFKALKKKVHEMPRPMARQLVADLERQMKDFFVEKSVEYDSKSGRWDIG
jgi:hypothetical protein